MKSGEEGGGSGEGDGGQVKGEDGQVNEGEVQEEKSPRSVSHGSNDFD